MRREADEAREKLAKKPELIVGKPESFYDESPIESNLYSPVLQKHIREIKRWLIPITGESAEDKLRLNVLQQAIQNARSQLLRITDNIKREEDKDVIHNLKLEADIIRNDVAELEYKWNTDEVVQNWLNTPEGGLWLSSVLALSEKDFVSNKAVNDLPPLYLQRLRLLGLEGYNAVIRQEKALAQDMAIMTMGVGLAIGDPGSGKTAFIAVWNFLLKYLFGYKSILDFTPRRPFGEWYLFNTDKLKLEQERMKLLHEGKLEEAGIEPVKDDKGNLLPPEAQWAAAHFSLLFRKACFSADEYSDYYPRLGQGRTRMGAAIFNFHRKWRHNDLLILGATPKIEEVDINMCQHYITHHIIVKPHEDAPDECTKAIIYPKRVVAGQYVAEVKREPFEFDIWGLEPRDYLGGECFYHIFNTKNPQKLKFSAKLTDD